MKRATRKPPLAPLSFLASPHPIVGGALEARDAPGDRHPISRASSRLRGLIERLSIGQAPNPFDFPWVLEPVPELFA